MVYIFISHTRNLPVHSVRPLLLIAILHAVLTPGMVSGQDLYGTVSGTVLDAETQLPLIGAHAFIGSTLIGTVTDNGGQFVLQRIPEGSHSLWISMVGYEPISEDFIVDDSTSTTGIQFDLEIEPAIIEVGEVTVTARKDRRWKKRLKTFKKMFLGETPFSTQTTILNPESLDFDSNWLGAFKAHASEPLLIENHALGYNVTYVLKEFKREGTTIRYDGDPLFEELTPANAEEQERWVQNRELAFHGSFHHFLLSLLDGNTDQEGFEIMHLPSIEDIPHTTRRFGIDPLKLVVPGDKEGERLLSFNGVLEITYMNEKENHQYLRWKGGSPHQRPSFQRSWIRLTSGPTAIDPNGEVIDPYGVTVYGYYAYERIADELPKEYRPLGSAINNP